MKKVFEGHIEWFAFIWLAFILVVVTALALLEEQPFSYGAYDCIDQETISLIKSSSQNTSLLFCASEDYHPYRDAAIIKCSGGVK